MKIKFFFVLFFLMQIVSFTFIYKFSYESNQNHFEVTCSAYQQRFNNFVEELTHLEANYPGIKKVLIDMHISKQQIFVAKCMPIPNLSIDDFLKHARDQFEYDQMGFNTYEHFQASLLNIIREYDILKGPQLYIENQDFWLHSFSQAAFINEVSLSSNSTTMKWIEIAQRLITIFTYIGLACSFRRD